MMNFLEMICECSNKLSRVARQILNKKTDFAPYKIVKTTHNSALWKKNKGN